MERGDRERAAWEGDARAAPAKVGGEHVRVHCGTHEADVQRLLARLLQQPPQREQEEIALDGALVHLVNQHVRHGSEAGVVLEHAEQHARRAEEQARAFALHRLATHGVAHGARARLGHTFSY
eukprot:3690938-Prymnesium_polylepis.1